VNFIAEIIVGLKRQRSSELKNFWTEIMEKRNDNPRYALCLENKDCEDLEKRKIYQVLPDDDVRDLRDRDLWELA
jgi:hypothetical protein